MENTNFKYSFEDEVASVFYYDMDNKKIVVGFTGYSDRMRNEYKSENCFLIIENWNVAKSKLADESKVYDLEKHLGIISMILFIKSYDEITELLVNTIDNRYVTLIFTNPKILLELRLVL